MSGVEGLRTTVYGMPGGTHEAARLRWNRVRVAVGTAVGAVVPSAETGRGAGETVPHPDAVRQL